ncbi:MAG: ABC transporter permease [Chthoniobacterales bacterium]
MSELRYALRSLGKSRTFTLAAILTLALGIGANTAIFTVVNGVLLRPLPYSDPARLVTLKSQQSVPELEDVREQSQSFAAVGGVGAQAVDYSGGAEPVQFQAGLVAADFFPVLGAHAALGRLLNAEDDRFGAPPLVVLTHGLWQRQFGGDAQIIGREIVLAGRSHTVVGVTTPDFRAPNPALEVFVPVHVFYPLAAKARGAHLLRLYARLRPGVTIDQATSELRLIDQRMGAANPDENKNRASTVLSLQERLVGDVRPALLILTGAVALVLLIACANFANLLLARTTARSQELSIRAALGAGRGELVRQVLLESVLLAIFGGMLGLVIGGWGVDALLALKPDELPRLDNIVLDGRVLAFTFGLSFLTGVVFGLVPAWQATRLDLNSVLVSGTRRLTSSRSGLRSALVVAELALALLLLTGAALLGKAFWRLTSVDPGFNPVNLLTLRVELPESRYKEVERQTRFREETLENMNNLPGVEAAMVSELPLGGSALNHNFIIEGREPIAKGEEPELYNRSIAGDYFKVLGIPLLRGRVLTPQDRASAPLVGVINDSMARQYFREQDPIGARIRWARNEGVTWITIVGVVGNVRHFGLAQPEEPAIYTPYAQSGQEWKRWSEFVVRTNDSSDATIAQLKRAMWKVDPLIPIAKVQRVSEVISLSLSARRFNALLIGVFAGVALLLAAVGLYGVIAYLVQQRTHEIGVRMAIGAQRRDILHLVLRHGLTLSAIGGVIGMCGALATSRVLRGMLYGIEPTDPATFASVMIALFAVALTAIYFPARRAMNVQPMEALRYE